MSEVPRKRRTSGNGSQASQASRSAEDTDSRQDSRPEPNETPQSGTRGTRGTRTRKAPTPALQKRLEDYLATPALVYGALGDEYGAWIIANRTPAMAESWYELSKQNKGVQRVLEGMLEGGAWGGVVLNTLAVVLPLLAHHGLLPINDPFAILDGGAPVPSRPTGPSRPVPFTPAPGPTSNPETVPPFVPPESEPLGVVTVAGRDQSVMVGA